MLILITQQNQHENTVWIDENWAGKWVISSIVVSEPDILIPEGSTKPARVYILEKSNNLYFSN